jgi:sterol 3beta-glucosyltransferase
VALASFGTRGDMQPLVCVGHELARRGHRVKLLAGSNAAEMADAAGLEFAPLPVDTQRLFRSPTAQRMLAGGRLSAFFRWLWKEERAFAAGISEVLIEHTDGADLLVSNVFLEMRCRAIAEAREVGWLPIHLFPHIPSRSYVCPALPQRDLRPLNRASHEVLFEMAWRGQRADIAAIRDRLGLRPATRTLFTDATKGRLPSVQAYSRAIFPAPADWPAAARPSGPILASLDLRERFGEAGIGKDLETWLGAGPPPVFFGFGSMPVLDERSMLATIRTVVTELGARGIVAAGWSELDARVDDDSIFVVGEVDHRALLPRCAAAVHHGGAGTLAVGVAAGAPTLVCSVFGDQPFWGSRCRALGIGETFPFKRLDAARLRAGLEAVLGPRVAIRAGEMGKVVAAEDGLGEAVGRIEAAGS